MLSPNKKDLIISYIMRFSDTLSDYFYDIANDDLEHYLEGLDDKKLISIYKMIKEEHSDNPITEDTEQSVQEPIDYKYISNELKKINKDYINKKNELVNRIGFNDKFSEKWLKELDVFEKEHYDRVQELIRKVKDSKNPTNIDKSWNANFPKQDVKLGEDFDKRPAIDKNYIEIEAPVGSKDDKMFNTIKGNKNVFKKSKFGTRNYESIGKRNFYNFHQSEKQLLIDRLNKLYEKTNDEDILSWIEDIGSYDSSVNECNDLKLEEMKKIAKKIFTERKK